MGCILFCKISKTTLYVEDELLLWPYCPANYLQVLVDKVIWSSQSSFLQCEAVHPWCYVTLMFYHLLTNCLCYRSKIPWVGRCRKVLVGGSDNKKIPGVKVLGKVPLVRDSQRRFLVWKLWRVTGWVLSAEEDSCIMMKGSCTFYIKQQKSI